MASLSLPFIPPPTKSSVELQPPSAVFQGISNCSSMHHLAQLHSQIVRLGLSTDNDAVGRLIKFCALSPSSDFNYALKLFDTIPEPDVFIYNTLLTSQLHHRSPLSQSLLLYSQLLQSSLIPNNFTFPSLIRACCLAHDVEAGKQIHAHVLKLDLGCDPCTLNNLIHMYLHFQSLQQARTVFDTMHNRNSISWVTLISGYSKCGLVDEALEIFQSMPARNPAAWNAIIAAHVQNGRFDEAFALLDKMRGENVVMDKFVAATMLSASTGLGSLEKGERMHKLIQETGIDMDAKLATAIIDMYCKCGCLEKALEAFNALRVDVKSVSSWNAMIGGLAMHGEGELAIELFKEMEKEGKGINVAPDSITFVNLLSGCAHSGLVNEGSQYFRYMSEVHGLEPGREHFGCMVDLLGRAGMLKEARKVIEEMPVEPDASVLGALLGGCKKHNEVEMGEEAGKRAVELEPGNSGRYVLLANLYEDAGEMEEGGNAIRKVMNERGVKKEAGVSRIEVGGGGGGGIREFVAGGKAEREVYEKVDEMMDLVGMTLLEQ